jgi:hypothetical protein
LATVKPPIDRHKYDAEVEGSEARLSGCDFIPRDFWVRARRIACPLDTSLRKRASGTTISIASDMWKLQELKRRQTSGGSRRGLDSEICTALSASLSAFLIYIRELTIGLGFNLHAKVLFPSACERSRYSGSRRCGASRCGEACACAVQRIPVRLRKAIRHNATNHLATEVSNGERTLYVIRGKIIVERR